MTSRTEYCTQTPIKPSLFDVQYLRNHRTLGIGVLGYIGIVWPKEHSPEVRSFPPGTPCIYSIYIYIYIYLYVWYFLIGGLEETDLGRISHKVKTSEHSSIFLWDLYRNLLCDRKSEQCLCVQWESLRKWFGEHGKKQRGLDVCRATNGVYIENSMSCRTC